MQPTLIIGLGGTGAHVVSNILARFQDNPSTAETVGGMLQFLYIDADIRLAENLKLPEQYKQSIGFFALPYIEQTCQQDENLKKWFDCQIVRRAPFMPEQFDLTRSTAMYRQFGRLSLYHDLANGNYSKVKASIRHTLLSIQQQTPNPPLVIICTSLIGGTGGAIALDVAYLVRHILETININAHVLGVFALGNVFASAFSSAPKEHHIRFILNEVAALKEIQHFAQTKYEFGPQGNVITFNNLEPFNSYWLFGGDRAERLEGKWPNDYFPLIATEISSAVLSGDWIMRHQELKYVNIQAPLTTSVIGDWSYWEDVYNRHIKDPNRLSPHINREFENQGAG
jgi:hypothetical protein